ncbi:MAG: NUDIX domain-containing protein [Candidatus Andersenbacteria bacterium]|nr:NUDIX domain-containing protein [Candidatus Andersenbacteria bacterium]
MNQENPEQRPRVGIGLFIIKDGKVLMGKRKGAHGAGEYCGPGGHLEYMESFEECAKRETMEEVGIEIENIRFLCLSNLTKYAPKHYVDIGILADWKSGEPTVMEPDKRENWDWYDIDNLPSPLFGVEPQYIEAYKTGKNYFDA